MSGTDERRPHDGGVVTYRGMKLPVYGGKCPACSCVLLSRKRRCACNLCAAACIASGVMPEREGMDR